MPTPPSPMPRAVLLRRIWATRRALDELDAQAAQDGWGALGGTGALKKALYDLERARDEGGEIYPDSAAGRVNAHLAGQERLKQAGTPVEVLEAMVAQQYPEPGEAEETSLGHILAAWKQQTMQRLRDLIASEKDGGA